MRKLLLLPILILCMSSLLERSSPESWMGSSKTHKGSFCPASPSRWRRKEPSPRGSSTSDVDGSYRFPNLPPGTYNVTYEMPGFATLRREGIVTRAQTTITVNVTLELATVAETITVTGESPVVDVKSTRVGGDFDSTALEDIPSATDMWSVLAQSPGVRMGGLRRGRQPQEPAVRIRDLRYQRPDPDHQGRRQPHRGHQRLRRLLGLLQRVGVPGECRGRGRRDEHTRGQRRRHRQERRQQLLLAEPHRLHERGYGDRQHRRRTACPRGNLGTGSQVLRVPHRPGRSHRQGQSLVLRVLQPFLHRPAISGQDPDIGTDLGLFHTFGGKVTWQISDKDTFVGYSRVEPEDQTLPGALADGSPGVDRAAASPGIGCTKWSGRGSGPIACSPRSCSGTSATTISQVIKEGYPTLTRKATSRASITPRVSAADRTGGLPSTTTARSRSPSGSSAITCRTWREATT